MQIYSNHQPNRTKQNRMQTTAPVIQVYGAIHTACRIEGTDSRPALAKTSRSGSTGKGTYPAKPCFRPREGKTLTGASRQPPGGEPPIDLQGHMPSDETGLGHSARMKQNHAPFDIEIAGTRRAATSIGAAETVTAAQIKYCE
jgi:hypothetical protein